MKTGFREVTQGKTEEPEQKFNPRKGKGKKSRGKKKKKKTKEKEGEWRPLSRHDDRKREEAGSVWEKYIGLDKLVRWEGKGWGGTGSQIRKGTASETYWPTKSIRVTIGRGRRGNAEAKEKGGGTAVSGKKLIFCY